MSADYYLECAKHNARLSFSDRNLFCEATPEEASDFVLAHMHCPTWKHTVVFKDIDPIFFKSVFDLELSVRLRNVLRADEWYWCRHTKKHTKSNFIGDLVQCDENDIGRIPNCGRKTTNEIKELLSEMGLYFGMTIHGWDDLTLDMKQQKSKSLYAAAVR